MVEGNKGHHLSVVSYLEKILILGSAFFIFICVLHCSWTFFMNILHNYLDSLSTFFILDLFSSFSISIHQSSTMFFILQLYSSFFTSIPYSSSIFFILHLYFSFFVYILHLYSSFWTQGLPVGVHSNRPCPSVRLSVCLSVFKYLRDRSLVFSETLHQVRGQLSKKSDTAEILKKNLNPGIKGD